MANIKRKLSLLTVGLLSLTLIACHHSDETSDQSKQFIDYVHGESVKLNLDYEGKDFYKDGVGQVTLALSIDGDTTHFYPVVKTTSDQIIKIRYYGIDTPESTGRIQMWGKTASNFTKEKIKNAEENGTIVVSSAQEQYGVPSHDSTGSRYLGLVWINENVKNAPSDSLILLNLWIVQEGLSWVKNVQDMPSYADTFYAAQRQAEDFKMCLFSDEEEPGWNSGDYEVTSLLDLKREMEKSILDPTYANPFDGKKVRVTGAVAGYSKGTMYLVDYYAKDKYPEAKGEKGEWAGINIFCGMSQPSSIYTKYNTYLELCAYAVNSETFGFQLTGAEGHFPAIQSLAKPDDAHIIYKADENAKLPTSIIPFEYTPAELSAIAENKNFESLYCAVNLTEPIEVNRFYINPDGDEITLGFKNCKFSVYVTNFSWCKFDPEHPEEQFKTEEQYMGRSFMVSGVYTWHRTKSGKLTFQIAPTSKDSMKLVA